MVFTAVIMKMTIIMLEMATYNSFVLGQSIKGRRPAFRMTSSRSWIRMIIFEESILQ
jgi:hypothetical protein